MSHLRHVKLELLKQRKETKMNKHENAVETVKRLLEGAIDKFQRETKNFSADGVLNNSSYWADGFAARDIAKISTLVVQLATVKSYSEE